MSAAPAAFKGLTVLILGSDTGAGKTVVTAALLRAFAGMGFAVQAVKPVQTGCDAAEPDHGAGTDAPVYRRACAQAHAVTLRSFAAPVSPHLAALREGARLDARDLARDILALGQKAEITLAEGAGGVLSPLNDTETMAELAVALDCPVLLVCPNRLGVVSQALASLESLRARGVRVPGFVLSHTASCEETPDSPAMLADNPQSIARHSGVPCLGVLPFAPDLETGPPTAREAAWDQLARALAPAAKALLGRKRGACGNAAPEPPGLAQRLAFDRAHIWHPYTSAVDPLPVWEAEATGGPYIHLAGHGPVVDGMSSWWSAVHGYNHPRLLEALRRQAARMPHVMFGGLTHQPAVDLAATLLELAPQGMERVFFADSGSVAVEVALKMAVQYQRAQGRPEKNRILTPRGGYHGDTLLAMSVCDPVTGMHGLFRHVLPEQIFAPRPETPFHLPYDPGPARAAEALFDRHGRDIAAVILEPVVQGAGGMWMYHPHYVRDMAALCGEHGALLILDEIATGFGRTGKMFAAQWAELCPDILCVGKALTGGTMTLAATMATDEVARGISAEGGVLMHGPTFMANPLACAVGRASLDLLRESPWEERVRALERGMREGLEPCRGLSGVADVRVLGGIGVVEMREAVDVARLQAYFVRGHGVWLRPFGRLIYMMPPYPTSEEHLARLTRAVRGAVEEGVWR